MQGQMDLLKIANSICLNPDTDSASSRTAGVIEFKRDTGPLRRDLRSPGYQWSSESLKNLAKILWNAQRAHNHTIAALRLFSKVPSSSLSPDGLLGGLGYIQSIKDMRSNLAATIESLSSFNDTIQDEISANHWKSSSDDEVSAIMQDVSVMKSDPEQFSEKEYEEEISPIMEQSNPDSEEMNPILLENERKAFSRDSVIRPSRAFRASDSLPHGTTFTPIMDTRGPGGGNEAGNYNPQSDMWPSDDPNGDYLFSGPQDSISLYDYSGFPQAISNPTDGDRSSYKRK